MHEAYLAQVKRLALVTALVAASLSACACAGAVNARPEMPAQDDDELRRVRIAVEASLTAVPPRGYASIPTGVRLLSIARGTDRQIVLNFSRELLAGGTGRTLEDALHQVLAAASRARAVTSDPAGAPAAGRLDDFRVLVDETDLERLLP
jgi:hypothetical protein